MSLFNTFLNTVSSGVSFLLNPELDTTRHYLGIVENPSNTADFGFTAAVSENVVSNISNITTNVIAAIPDVSRNFLSFVFDNASSFSNSTSLVLNQQAPMNQNKGLPEDDISSYMLPLTAALPVVAYLGFKAFDYYMQDCSVQSTVKEDMPSANEPEVLCAKSQTVSLTARQLGKKALESKDRNFTQSFNSMSLAQKSRTLRVDNSNDHSVQRQEMMIAADEIAKGLSKLYALQPSLK